MQRAYSTKLQQFRTLEAGEPFVLSDDVIWIDLDRPSADVERELERQLGIELPTREEMKDIEPSSRLYQEGGATYMTATVLWRADTDAPESTNIGFVLYRNRLVTIRYAEPQAFRAFMSYADRERSVLTDGPATLVLLLEAIIDRTAEVLERTGAVVDAISQRIFQRKRDPKRRRSGQELEAALTEIAFNQNMTAKARESLVSLGRMVSFAMLADGFANNHEYRDHLRSVMRDIESLTNHASFLLSNMNFLLDAALGLVNIEQNQIIKIFSVAAVVFLPPTLVASSYGMNFVHMPELKWLFGYPMAIVLMAVSAAIPYLWFKRKGWL